MPEPGTDHEFIVPSNTKECKGSILEPINPKVEANIAARTM